MPKVNSFLLNLLIVVCILNQYLSAYPVPAAVQNFGIWK